MQIVMTAVVCCWAHLMMPADPRKTSPVLGVSLTHANGSAFLASRFCMSADHQAVLRKSFRGLPSSGKVHEGQDTLHLTGHSQLTAMPNSIVGA